MKKAIFAVLLAVFLSACGSKVYNNALKQVELGMTRNEIVTLMGDQYTSTGERNVGGKTYEKLEYKDRYKNHWFFEFADGQLHKWFKEVEK